MYRSQWPWFKLYKALLEYDGSDAYADVLEPWPQRNLEECAWLAEFAQRPDRAADHEDLCRLYAAWRVTSILLLRFQSGRAAGSHYPGPAISPEGFRRFHQALGLRLPQKPRFHPFFHEIVGVEPRSPDASPIEVVDEIWPPVMLGDMMFCRAGSIVSGGEEHVIKDVAECSRLYWIFRRKDRPYEDESHGWGDNSEWRTCFRRDYQSAGAFLYNVDGPRDLNAATGNIDGIRVATMIELVRNRYLIRSVADDSPLSVSMEIYRGSRNGERGRGGRVRTIMERSVIRQRWASSAGKSWLTRSVRSAHALSILRETNSSKHRPHQE